MADKKVGSETGMTKKYESFTCCLSFLNLSRVARIVFSLQNLVEGSCVNNFLDKEFFSLSILLIQYIPRGFSLYLTLMAQFGQNYRKVFRLTFTVDWKSKPTTSKINQNKTLR